MPTNRTRRVQRRRADKPDVVRAILRNGHAMAWWHGGDNRVLSAPMQVRYRQHYDARDDAVPEVMDALLRQAWDEIGDEVQREYGRDHPGELCWGFRRYEPRDNPHLPWLVEI